MFAWQMTCSGQRSFAMFTCDMYALHTARISINVQSRKMVMVLKCGAGSFKKQVNKGVQHVMGMGSLHSRRLSYLVI